MQIYFVHWESGTLYLLYFTIDTVAIAILLCNEEPPLPDQLLGEHTGPHPHLVQYTYFAIAFS